MRDFIKTRFLQAHNSVAKAKENCSESDHNWFLNRSNWKNTSIEVHYGEVGSDAQ